MRTITTTIYSFDELSEQAKQKAIENIRECYYVDNDFAQWVIDDCSLLEPKELQNEDSILIENNRKVYFDLDRNKHLDISQAMEIKNSTKFLKWLGLNDNLIDKVDYTIHADEIEFSNQSDDEFTEGDMIVLDLAEEKFKNHCNYILERIEMGIEYRYSDEGITEDIYNNDWEFTEDGKTLIFRNHE